MSPVFLVSIIDVLMSPALDTAHDSVGFYLSKYFKISGLFCVKGGTFLTHIPYIHSWEETPFSILLSRQLAGQAQRQGISENDI